MEADGWISLLAEPAEPPEDWSGSVDINSEDLPGQRPPALRDWQNELELVDAPEINLDQN